MTKASAVIFHKQGQPIDVLRIGHADLPEIGDDEVLLKTLASPLNPSDIETIDGKYGKSPNMNTLFSSEPAAVAGFEGVLEVLQVGKDVKDIKVGDWALPKAFTYGIWRTHHILKATQVFTFKQIPGVDVTTVAAIQINPLTAYQILTHYHDLKEGDWIIQNVGNSAVARAISQLAHLWGVKTINVIRDRKDFKEIEAELKAIGTDIVITDKQLEDPGFVASIPKLTNSETNPIKIGLDAVGDANGSAIAVAVQNSGTFVVYGSMTRKPFTISSDTVIFNRVTIRGYWLGAVLSKGDRTQVDKDLKEIIKLLESGKFKTAPVEKHVFKSGAPDEENLKSVLSAIYGLKNGYTSKKHTLVFE